MPRAMHEDGTPWWVSHGPADSAPAEPAAATSDGAMPDWLRSGEQLLSGFDPKLAGQAFNAGIGLFTAFAELVSEPLDPDRQEQTTHDIESCGVCPVCVAVAALKEHEPRIGGLVESALAGVTSSGERLAELIPNARDAVTDQLVAAVLKSVLQRFQS